MSRFNTPFLDTSNLEPLKSFFPTPKGFWENVPAALWNDWHWQLKNRIQTAGQLLRLLPRPTKNELAALSQPNNRLAIGITPYFFNLIDPDDPDCPIRRQVVPTVEELYHAPDERVDPCDEEAYSPVPGLVHRYPDRVLFLVHNRCAGYCRYCTRSRIVGQSYARLPASWEARLNYMRMHKEIRDVLLSGGDPLLLSDSKLEQLVRQLRLIRHVEVIRIGTRVPIFLPQRITVGLCDILRRYHPIFMSVHVNHPKELTLESRAALERIADAGIPIGNQSVLLRGINDDPAIMKALVQKLLICRVRPYYLYQCDLVVGTSHFRVPLKRGLEIIRQLRGHTTGYAVPSFVVEVPDGGKIVLEPEVIIGASSRGVRLRSFEGREVNYPDSSLSGPEQLILRLYS